MRMLLLFALVVASGLSPLAVAGKTVFRWQDADGVLHYGDRPGTAEAAPVQPGTAPMSIVDTAEARARNGRNAMRPVIERELRWQQEGRREQQRAAEAEIAGKARRCEHLQSQLAAAEKSRRRARVIALEEQYYSACR